MVGVLRTDDEDAPRACRGRQRGARRPDACDRPRASARRSSRGSTRCASRRKNTRSARAGRSSRRPNAVSTSSRSTTPRGIVWIKRAKRLQDRPLPRAIGPRRPVDQLAQENALRRLARPGHRPRARARGRTRREHRSAAARRPRIARRPGAATPLERDRDRRVRRVLEDSVLFVQGHPGPARPTPARASIVDLMARGLRVGVAATSHKAIHNMLDEVEAVAPTADVSLRWSEEGLQGSTRSRSTRTAATSSRRPTTTTSRHRVRRCSSSPARRGCSRARRCDDAVDVLVIDEAGQVALADALAMAQAARNLVLLGDPQQLAQVSQGTHPRGSGASVLEHLLGARDTVPPDAASSSTIRGGCTRTSARSSPRRCTTACSSPSRRAHGGASRRPASSTARACASCRSSTRATARRAEEADGDRRHRSTACSPTARLGRLRGSRHRPRDARRHPRRRALQRAGALPARRAARRRARRHRRQVPGPGGADRLLLDDDLDRRGRAARHGLPVQQNRLNVAVSRAQCLAIIVASPALLTARCNTVEQMRLINALCQFADLAEAQAARADDLAVGRWEPW